MSSERLADDLSRRTLLIVICWSRLHCNQWVKPALDLLIIMTKYTLILAPLEVFAKRTFLGQGLETAALPDPEQMKQASSSKLQAASFLKKKNLTYVGSSYIR